MLGSTTDKVERAFTHEVGHLYDRDIGNFSDNSELFFPDGELHAEIKKYTGTSAKAGDLSGHAWFAYALQAVRTPHRELYAQNFALFNHDPELMREHLPKTYQAISRLASGGATSRALDAFTDSRQGKSSQGEPTDRNNGAGKTQRETVAAKKSALLEAARANDPALLKELSKSDDAKSLQRAVAELPPGAAADAANTRMAELVQDPDTEPDEEELPSS